MKLAKNLLGGLAIAGLAFAQPAAAQASATRSVQSLPSASTKAPVVGVRAGAVNGQAEGIANGGDRMGAIWWVAGLVAATGLFILAVVDHDDEHGVPVSPG